MYSEIYNMTVQLRGELTGNPVTAQLSTWYIVDILIGGKLLIGANKVRYCRCLGRREHNFIAVQQQTTPGVDRISIPPFLLILFFHHKGYSEAQIFSFGRRRGIVY